MDIAQEKLITFNNEPDLLKRVITGDADFFLFRKQITTMKRKRFATIEEIKEKSKQELLAEVAVV